MAKTNRRDHSTRQLVFDMIVQYKSAHDGLSPSMRELCVMADIASTSTVEFHLNSLAREGKIILIQRGMSRGIQVPGGQWSYGNGLSAISSIENHPG